MVLSPSTGTRLENTGKLCPLKSAYMEVVATVTIMHGFALEGWSFPHQPLLCSSH